MLAMAVCVLGATICRAEPELEIFCTVVRGNIVEIGVRNEDNTPAKGLKVALVDAQKNVIAAGKINADGEWSWPAPAPGAYELVLGTGAGDKDLRFPIDVKPVALPSPEPDPDRVRCDHCPPRSADVAAEPPVPPSFPWLPALGLIAVYGAVRLSFGHSWPRPANQTSTSVA
jgi:hypothetical protein